MVISVINRLSQEVNVTSKFYFVVSCFLMTAFIHSQNDVL